MSKLWEHIKLTTKENHTIFCLKSSEADLDEIEDKNRNLTKTAIGIKNIKDSKVFKTFKLQLAQWPGFINNLRGLKEK